MRNLKRKGTNKRIYKTTIQNTSNKMLCRSVGSKLEEIEEASSYKYGFMK